MNTFNVHVLQRFTIASESIIVQQPSDVTAASVGTNVVVAVLVTAMCVF